ncbi:MAG TPA: excinuclease ABC subunit UvrB [Planctomycetes bacterium]|nr:excinuclease ABC subunit UvrB [Planctomycetota bacterium]HIL36111.1 excinuclease ABC subunit UvrB [Planctomycetota bacterium]
MVEHLFRLITPFEPTGHQPGAIDALVRGVEQGLHHQTLLGITGSGKTFTVAKVIERINRPALVLSPNKTLAAQLFAEFKELFPHNAVEYFVSYYDYYQPEAYVPSTDTFIEKDASRNENIERLRNSATRSLLDRRDVILVASVSCIYGLGSPSNYSRMAVTVTRGQVIERDDLLRQLTQMQYARNNMDFRRGAFRVRGDVVEVFPAYEEDCVLRFEFFGDEIEAINRVNPFLGEVLSQEESVTIYPANHYVTPADRLNRALPLIQEELLERLEELKSQGKLLEAQRLEMRTNQDLELLKTTGVCGGVENYSRYMDGRDAGEPPFTLMHYFPEDWVLFVDESHVAVPQVGAMYKGDRSRKTTLVEHGFRLPSALDNRPLRFDEFERRVQQTIYISATPGDYELKHSGQSVVEQVVRPTGLLDPQIEVRPQATQVDDLLHEIRLNTKRGWRTLVTTLTKRSAEDLTTYYGELGVRVRWLHSEVDVIERTAILRDLRLGEFDVLVGINLLREGLDLPEVALVAVLDADKEGFLRARTSLIQICGRAARNVEGRVLFYGDKITDSMRFCIDEVHRRRALQEAWNQEHGLVPTTIIKPVRDSLEALYEMDYAGVPSLVQEGLAVDDPSGWSLDKLTKTIERVRGEMLQAAGELRFEDATASRDRLRGLEAELLGR